MSSLYTEKEFNNWTELKNFLGTLNSDWMFRGQADYTNNLATSIDRLEFNSRSPKNPKQKFEQFSIRQLQRRPDLYKEKYDLKSGFETISLLQHYGSPTRLLDFTLSQYVAMFFAMAKSKEDGAIYAINHFELNSSFSHLFRLKYNDDSEAIKLLKENADTSNHVVFDKLILNAKQRKFVQIVQPFYLFDRMIQQKGCFLCQGDVNVSFEENLKENFSILQNMKDCSPYYKLKIKQSWKEEVLRDLDKMNISYQSLFPGIEGFTKTLKGSFDIILGDRGPIMSDG
jgi:hypothetical protein